MGSSGGFDYSFKILLIGDSGVGKSSLLLSSISNYSENITPTIAGQEKFRTLNSSYYRGSQGIILVYDVTSRESFTNLCDVWVKEIENYSTNPDCVRVLVGNKVDRESERAVTRDEGTALASQLGCIFIESSAKTKENSEQCFQELATKILEVPSLLIEGSAATKRTIVKVEQNTAQRGSCCFFL